jgi:hypothetical protein
MATAESMAPETMSASMCPTVPARSEIRIGEEGFRWLEGEWDSGECDEVPSGRWTRAGAGSLGLCVYSDGPGGSGRFWSVTIGLVESRASAPARGFCLSTTTIGWRTLLRYQQTPLPWIADMDEDGAPEFLLWTSFPLADEASAAEWGLVVWIYELREPDLFVIDWELTERMASELAEAYEQPVEDNTLWLLELRKKAAEQLRRIASGECRVVSEKAR